MEIDILMGKWSNTFIYLFYLFIYIFIYLPVQKEKRIRELHSMLQKKFSAQIGSANNDDSRASDSAFSEVCV